MSSQSDPTFRDSALDEGISELPEKAPTRNFSEATADCADTDFLQGYINEPDYARRRGVTLRTCQRDRQLRKAPPHIKLGRHVYYRVDAVRDWLVKNERIAVQTPGARPSRFLRKPDLLPKAGRS